MKINASILFTLLTLFTIGCTRGSNTWSYRPIDVNRTKPINKSITVITFQDTRDSKKDYDDTMLAFIPVVNKGKRLKVQPELSSWYPFYSSEYNVPEGNCVRATDSGEYNQFRPGVNFASAFYTEINNENLFKEVRFGCNRLVAKSDYYLEGKIIDTSIYTELKTYHVGLIFAYVPWLLGAPSDENLVNLKMQLQLTDKENKIIFKKVYDAAPKTIISSLYEQNTLMVYEDMIKEIYTQFNKDIKNLKL
jgi:hypothetical protein